MFPANTCKNDKPVTNCEGREVACVRRRPGRHQLKQRAGPCAERRLLATVPSDQPTRAGIMNAGNCLERGLAQSTPAGTVRAPYGDHLCVCRPPLALRDCAGVGDVIQGAQLSNPRAQGSCGGDGRQGQYLDVQPTRAGIVPLNAPIRWGRLLQPARGGIVQHRDVADVSDRRLTHSRRDAFAWIRCSTSSVIAHPARARTVLRRSGDPAGAVGPPRARKDRAVRRGRMTQRLTAAGLKRATMINMCRPVAPPARAVIKRKALAGGDKDWKCADLSRAMRVLCMCGHTSKKGRRIMPPLPAAQPCDRDRTRLAIKGMPNTLVAKRWRGEKMACRGRLRATSEIDGLACLRGKAKDAVALHPRDCPTRLPGVGRGSASSDLYGAARFCHAALCGATGRLARP